MVRTRVPVSRSYASWTARNAGSDCSPAKSGWRTLASRRYARLISAGEAPGSNPRTAWGSRAVAIEDSVA